MAAELTCVESEELLALAALGVLTDAEAGGLEAHLVHCDHCRQMSGNLQRTVEALPDALEPVAAPASLRRRLMAEVYAGGTHRRRERWWTSLWNRVPQSRGFTVAGTLAAAAAVALAVWGSTRPTAPQPESFAVVASTSAPQAQGTLTYFPSSKTSVLTVSDMPKPQGVGSAPPNVYELWLIGGNGSAHPAAFLTESPLTHTWSASIPADLTQFVSVAATSELYGGSPQPTGPQLLSVQLSH